MKKANKFLYVWKLYVNYGFGDGWELETIETTFKNYRENRKAYRENCQYPTKWTRGRIVNPEYK